MELSRNFTLQELTKTATGAPNTPGKAESEKLLYLASYILQPLRDRFGSLRVTSAYRSAAVNSSVGGSSSSQHLSGEAADFMPAEKDIDTVFKWIVTESGLSFGQAIRERKSGNNWIHISLPRLDGSNQQALVYDGKGYKDYV